MKNRTSFALVASIAMVSSSLAPVSAHERRLLPADPGQIQLYVGHHVEPAFEDSYNAVDVILSSYDGACPGSSSSSISAAIDTSGTAGLADPDEVFVEVEALYLKAAVQPGGGGSIAPAGVIARHNITNASPIFEVFNSPGTYDTAFRPTHPGDGSSGAYGYHVTGVLHAGAKSAACPNGKTYTLAARNAIIDTYFVCGLNGTLVPPDNFGCIRAIEPFPGTVLDGYRPNSPY